jgi:hypothetical protein
MCHLTDVARSRDTAKTNSKTKYESASEEHGVGGRRCLNAGSNDDDERTNKHACSTTKAIVGRTREEDCCYRANVVHSKYNPSARTSNSPSMHLARNPIDHND